MNTNLWITTESTSKLEWGKYDTDCANSRIKTHIPFQKSFDLKYETRETVTSKTVITITSSAVVSNILHVRKMLNILLGESCIYDPLVVDTKKETGSDMRHNNITTILCNGQTDDQRLNCKNK